jgi:hypothetical protein
MQSVQGQAYGGGAGACIELIGIERGEVIEQEMHRRNERAQQRACFVVDVDHRSHIGRDFQGAGPW